MARGISAPALYKFLELSRGSAYYRSPGDKQADLRDRKLGNGLDRGVLKHGNDSTKSSQLDKSVDARGRLVAIKRTPCHRLPPETQAYIVMLALWIISFRILTPYRPVAC